LLPIIPNQAAIFRGLYRAINVLTIASLLFVGYALTWEYSVRHYLEGFSDAVVPQTAAPEEKVQAILAWIGSGPARPVARDPNDLNFRDPVNTLNSYQLLSICGTATNAFLNLSRSAGLDARRLLLLTPEYKTKHVVAEVFIDGRWIIVDPTFRVILHDAQGHMLTRQDLQNPAIFAQATGNLPNYLPAYNYQTFAHVRIESLPLAGSGLRWALQKTVPDWDEFLDWSLLLERESFLVLFAALLSFLFCFFIRFLLARYADSRARVSAFQFGRHAARAGASFFYISELEE
jgi:hypothetical protein